MPYCTVYTIDGDDGSEDEYLIDATDIDAAAAEAVKKAGPLEMVTGVVQTDTTISHQSSSPGTTGRPRDDLFSVRRAAQRLAQARSALHIAVRGSVADGSSLALVAEAENLSVEQITHIAHQ